MTVDLAFLTQFNAAQTWINYITRLTVCQHVVYMVLDLWQLASLRTKHTRKEYIWIHIIKGLCELLESDFVVEIGETTAKVKDT